jgi:hypothetical protein
MRCPSCRADNPPDASSCIECGDAVQVAEDSKKPAIVYPIAQAQADEDDVVDVLPAASSAADEDDDEGDGGIGSLIPYRNPNALAAYYLGFFSLIPVAGLVTTPFAVAAGIMALRAVAADPAVKGTVHAWIGIIFGMFWIGIVLCALSLLWNPVLMPFLS